MSLHQSIPQPITEGNRQQSYDGGVGCNSNEHRLSTVASLNRGLEPGTWGITIVRTDYKAPLQQLLNALACINNAVQEDLGAMRPYWQRRDGMLPSGMEADPGWPTILRRQSATTASDEVFARYTIEVLSKYSSLNGASTDTVREHFQDWIMQKRGSTQGGDMRYVFCIILDTETIQKLHDIWCRASRVGAAHTQLQVRVLDALKYNECRSAYKLNLRGKYGLVNFWFTRSIRRQPLTAILTRPRPGDEDRTWCFGPWEPPSVEDGCDEQRTRQWRQGKGQTDPEADV